MEHTLSVVSSQSPSSFKSALQNYVTTHSLVTFCYLTSVTFAIFWLACCYFFYLSFLFWEGHLTSHWAISLMHPFAIKFSGFSIAGNFRGRKLLRIGWTYNLRGENYRRLLACSAPKDTKPPNLVEKTFANSHKYVKLAKVFFPQKFLLYGIVKIIVGYILHMQVNCKYTLVQFLKSKPQQS